MAAFVVDIQELQPLTRSEKMKLAAALQECIARHVEYKAMNGFLPDESIDEKIGITVQVSPVGR